MCTSGKLQSVPLKNSPPSLPTSTTNYHTKVLQHTELHYTESLYRRSCTGWLKSSSLEFPPFASVIKVDEGRTVSERGPQAKLCLALGGLAVCGERLLPSTPQPADIVSLFLSSIVGILMVITPNGNRQIKENNNKRFIQIIQNAWSHLLCWSRCFWFILDGARAHVKHQTSRDSSTDHGSEQSTVTRWLKTYWWWDLFRISELFVIQRAVTCHCASSLYKWTNRQMPFGVTSSISWSGLTGESFQHQ